MKSTVVSVVYGQYNGVRIWRASDSGDFTTIAYWRLTKSSVARLTRVANKEMKSRTSRFNVNLAEGGWSLVRKFA